MVSWLKNSIVFSDHSLATDASFGEMHLILCRNVLIYFTRKLQDRVFGLFEESLCPGTFLALGSKETIRFSSHSANFEDFDPLAKIYRYRYGERKTLKWNTNV
jgi:chemotaxis protein methyltransferase CheR